MVLILIRKKVLRRTGNEMTVQIQWLLPLFFSAIKVTKFEFNVTQLQRMELKLVVVVHCLNYYARLRPITRNN